MEPDEGTIRRADVLRIVSFAQDRTEHLDLESACAARSVRKAIR